MFHRIARLDPERDFLIYENSLSPEKLQSFAHFFAENNLKTLTFFDLKAMELGFARFPKKAVILTFDDGYDNHFLAAQILEQYGLHGVFFVITEKIDTPGYLTKAQIREMASKGHEIGSHSVTHPNMENLSEEQIRFEVGDSKKKIEEITGKKVISFCYPSGKYDNRSVSLLEREGYEFARTTASGKVFYPNKKFELTTMRIFPKSSLISLEYLFSDEQKIISKK